MSLAKQTPLSTGTTRRMIRLSMLVSALLLAACGGASDDDTQALAPALTSDLATVVAPDLAAGAVSDPASESAAPDGVATAAMVKFAPSFPLGANLPAVFDWTRTPMFVDLIHHARRFGSPATPWDEKAALGADGWPLGDFGVVLMSGQEGVSGNDGVYKVSFSGRATVRVESSDARISNLVYDATRKRSTLDVTLGDGVYRHNLMLSFTNTGTGIKNLKVIRPGYDAGRPPLFTRPFLDHIARFKTVRLMDWLRTNGNAVTSWATRATPDNTHYASPAGVPWEHVIALANQAGKDIWINIPLGADDDYVARLARLLKSSLNENSKIYIEYSNELWNSGFSQSGANRALAAAEVRANPASPLVYDHATDQYLIAFRRIAKRGKEISDIFRRAYGDRAMMSKVRPVLAGQIVQPYISTVGLKFVEAVYGPPSRYFYAVAGAPYRNLGAHQTEDGQTPDQVLRELGASVADMAVADSLESNLAATTWYGLKLLAYEGGFDTFGAGSVAAKKAASLDPRMRGLCGGYLSSWYANGGDLFMWFTAGAGNWDTQYGAWELTTDLALTDTPKIKCIDATLAAPLPAFGGRNQIPATINALAYAGNQPPYTEQSGMATRYLHTGSSLDYLIGAPAAGIYTLVINAQAGQAGNKIDVAVNGKPMASGFDIAVTGFGNFADNAPITLKLAKGANTLRLTTRAETSGYALSALTIR